MTLPLRGSRRTTYLVSKEKKIKTGVTILKPNGYNHINR